MIAKVIIKHISVQLKPINRPIYRKLYPKWVDKMIPLPKSYKVPNFTTFSRDNDKSIMEHVGQFTT